MSKQFQAFGTCLLVLRDKSTTETKTAGGIIVPGISQKEQPAFSGTVLSVGPHCEMVTHDGDGDTRPLLRGDHIIYGRHAPYHFPIQEKHLGDDWDDSYNDIVVVLEDDVCLVMLEGTNNLNLEKESK